MADVIEKAPPGNKMNAVLAATGDLGKASGLEAAAKVLLAMADHKRRVVGTGELKAAAAALEENAAEIRKRSQAVLDDIGSRVLRCRKPRAGRWCCRLTASQKRPARSW